MTRMGAVRALLLFAAVIGLRHRNLSKGLRVVCLNARGLLSFTLILNDGNMCRGSVRSLVGRMGTMQAWNCGFPSYLH